MATKRGLKAALKRALALLETYGWRQGGYGNTTSGFCVWGAIMRATPGGDVIRFQMGDAIRAQVGTHNLTGWNDRKGRRKATVLAAVRRAIEAA